MQVEVLSEQVWEVSSAGSELSSDTREVARSNRALPTKIGMVLGSLGCAVSPHLTKAVALKERVMYEF